MIVYFDTNVFDHLEQRCHGVTDWDLYRVQRAIKHECFRLVLSALNIEETLFIVRSQPERAVARVKLILELTDRRLFALGQELILNNDIRAYAHATPWPSPFIEMDPEVEFNIRNLVQPASTSTVELDGVVELTRQEKEKFKQFLAESKDKLKPMADKIGAKQYPFVDYLANNSGWLAKGLAERAGVLPEVEKRGVEGLLNIRSVALAVGTSLSLSYSHDFEGRAPRSGDSRDILHALIASVSDIFVTNDGKLREILIRIPISGFKVMSLREFLESLPRWV